MDIVRDVKAFHAACDVPILAQPAVPSEDRVKLRVVLLEEEMREFLLASANGDLIQIADALADLIYVAVGTALEYGIPLEHVWDEVQRSNMAKVDPATGKVHKRADGKILKPEGWIGPNIMGVLGV